MSLEKYMMLEQLQQMQNQGSPISRGVMQGMEAARNAIQLNDEQQRMTKAALWSKLAQGMQRTGYGPGFTGLARMNDAIGPAMDSYQAHVAKEKAINADLLRQSILEDRFQRQEALRQSLASERENYHKGLLEKRNKPAQPKYISPLQAQKHKRYAYNDLIKLEQAKHKEIERRIKNSGTAKFDEKEKQYIIDEIEKEYEPHIERAKQAVQEADMITSGYDKESMREENNSNILKEIHAEEQQEKQASEKPALSAPPKITKEAAIEEAKRRGLI